MSYAYIAQMQSWSSTGASANLYKIFRDGLTFIITNIYFSLKKNMLKSLLLPLTKQNTQDQGMKCLWEVVEFG